MIRAAGLVVLLSGCTAFTLTQAECRGTNWQQRGERDGFSGHPPQDLRYAQQCAPHGVVIAQADYLKGWSVGNDEHVRLRSLRCD